MRIPILVPMGPEEKADVVRQMRGDLNAANKVERQANLELRRFIIQMTVMMNAAVANLEDEDCVRFLVALRKAVGTVELAPPNDPN